MLAKLAKTSRIEQVIALVKIRCLYIYKFSTLKILRVPLWNALTGTFSNGNYKNKRPWCRLQKSIFTI